MYLKNSIIFYVSLLFLVGCNSNNNNTLPSLDENKVPLQFEQMKHGDKRNLNNEEIATHLAPLAASVPLSK